MRLSQDRTKSYVPFARVIAYEDGEVLTPSIVGFLGSGEAVVGRDVARRRSELDPRYVVHDAKRFIGRQFEDPSVDLQAKEYSFKVVNNNSRAAFEVPLHQKMLPETIGALVVKKLVKIAAKDLGHEVITSAVICVPAAFGPEQIKATAEAFKLAGLRVARILKEPVAAAVAYGLNRVKGIDHILVYDFGGGTLDVSVLYVQDGSVEVVANFGDNDLGGTDFDHCLAHTIHERVATEKSDDSVTIKLLEEKDSLLDNCDEPSAFIRLAETLKIALTDSETASIRCRRRENTVIEATVSRKAFETTLCGHLFDRAIKVVRDTLETSMIRSSEIDEVVLVGGTSRIPKVRTDLKLALNVSKLNTDIDPDITVAIGAASVID